MRILIVTQKVDIDDDLLGFFHGWIAEIAKRFSRVYVICLYEGRHELPENVSVVSLGKETHPSRVRYLIRFYRFALPLILLRRVNRIFIHMNEVYVFLLFPLLPIRKLLGIKLLWWKAHVRIGPLSRIARFFVDTILTTHEKTFPLPIRKRVVSGQGIDTTYFVPPADESRRKRNSIIMVGTVRPIKKNALVIEALSHLRRKGVSFHLTIVGASKEGERNEYQAACVEQIDRLGLKDVVTLHEAIPHKEIRDMFQRADIVVNATPGSLDKVILEGMACGAIPVTCSPALKDTLTPHGLFVEEQDPLHFAECLYGAVSRSESEKAALRSWGVEYVRGNHSLKSLVAKISAL